MTQVGLHPEPRDGAAEPPMRDIEDWPVHIRCREVPSLHELTGAGSNAEEDKKSRLPAPKNYLLTKHDRCSLEIEIGDYITFVRKTKDGERHVAPPPNSCSTISNTGDRKSRKPMRS